jgi:hypothetical protein
LADGGGGHKVWSKTRDFVFCPVYIGRNGAKIEKIDKDIKFSNLTTTLCVKAVLSNGQIW